MPLITHIVALELIPFRNGCGITFWQM